MTSFNLALNIAHCYVCRAVRVHAVSKPDKRRASKNIPAANQQVSFLTPASMN